MPNNGLHRIRSLRSLSGEPGRYIFKNIDDKDTTPSITYLVQNYE